MLYKDFTAIPSYADFDIIVVNPCLTDSLTIVESSFPSPALTYNLKDSATVFSWTDEDATSVGSLTICGSLTWDITAEDGITAIDSTIFTLDPAKKTLRVEASDFSKAATYTMQVKVYYTDFQAKYTTRKFDILLQVPCFRKTLTFETPIISVPPYQIGDPAVDIIFQEFKCPADLKFFCTYNLVYSANLVKNPFGGG